MMLSQQLVFASLIWSLAAALSCAFICSPIGPLPQFKSLSLSHQHRRRRPLASALCMSNDDNIDSRGSGTDEEGADLAAQFFQAMKDRNISFEGDEVDFADMEDDEFESTDSSYSATGDMDDGDDAILREYDVSMTGEGASLTNEQIYDEMKDRVFESAGAFVELTKGVAEEGDYDDSSAAMVYTPPVKVPDSGLTAGEVVELGKCICYMCCCVCCIVMFSLQH